MAGAFVLIAVLSWIVFEVVFNSSWAVRTNYVCLLCQGEKHVVTNNWGHSTTTFDLKAACPGGQEHAWVRHVCRAKLNMVGGSVGASCSSSRFWGTQATDPRLMIALAQDEEHGELKQILLRIKQQDDREKSSDEAPPALKELRTWLDQHDFERGQVLPHPVHPVNPVKEFIGQD